MSSLLRSVIRNILLESGAFRLPKSDMRKERVRAQLQDYIRGRLGPKPSIKKLKNLIAQVDERVRQTDPALYEDVTSQADDPPYDWFSDAALAMTTLKMFPLEAFLATSQLPKGNF